AQGAPLAELRLGVAGDHLAVDAKVIDPRVVQDPTVWQGSCVEVFGSMPDTGQIGQVFLVPRSGDAPAKAYRSKGGKQEPEEAIRIRSAPLPTGYALQALIPLSLLRVDAERGKLLLEFQITASRSARGKRQVVRGTLFGSALAYADNRRYGVFRVGKASAEEEQ
ncbi:MAG: hypothetical protein ACE5JM_03555, partial [Armatimonadota bacterium]